MATYRTMAQMRWSDMDAFGHVHNTKFLEYFELARSSLVMELAKVPHRASASLVVGRHEVDYCAPLVFRLEPIAVDTWVDTIGRSSFALAGEVLDPDSETVFARISTIMVAIDVGTGEPLTISDPVRRALEAYRRVDAS